MEFDIIEGLSKEDIETLYEDIIERTIDVNSNIPSYVTRQYMAAYVSCTSGSRAGYSNSASSSLGAWPEHYCGTFAWYTTGGTFSGSGSEDHANTINEYNIIRKVCLNGSGNVYITDCRN